MTERELERLDADPALRAYYARRAPEYERIYHRPERQADLRAMESVEKPEAACNTLASFVVEEGQPEFIEQDIATLLRRADLNTKLHGKDLLQMTGEYTVEVLASGSISGNILGAVKNGPGTQAVQVGATYQSYKPGDMVRVQRGGSMIVYCESAATVGGQVYARKSGTGVIGAAAASASGDHIAVTGVFFAETTTAAGPAPVRMPNPMTFPS